MGSGRHCWNSKGNCIDVLVSMGLGVWDGKIWDRRFETGTGHRRGFGVYRFPSTPSSGEIYLIDCCQNYLWEVTRLDMRKTIA